MSNRATEVYDAPGNGVMSRPSRKQIKLSTWAKRERIHIRTAQRMHQRGELPVPAFVTSTGRIMVVVEEEPLLNPREVTNMLHALKRQLDRIERKLDG